MYNETERTSISGVHAARRAAISADLSMQDFMMHNSFTDGYDNGITDRTSTLLAGIEVPPVDSSEYWSKVVAPGALYIGRVATIESLL